MREEWEVVIRHVVTVGILCSSVVMVLTQVGGCVSALDRYRHAENMESLTTERQEAENVAAQLEIQRLILERGMDAEENTIPD